MKYFDISGPVRPGIWHYDAPYFPFQMQSLSKPRWEEFPYYAESINMPMQSGTYIETAGHVFPDQLTTAQVPLERTVLLRSYCLQIPSVANSKITRAMIVDALKELAVHPLLGKV